MALNPSQVPVLEIAHVLFMDIVGYSKLPMDEQQGVLQRLQSTVRDTSDFRRAQDNDQLIRLPTGDGMALVFFGDPQAPARCAMELSQALRSFPEVQLRMGIHSGPVYRLADINANRNVSGGGINLAQRVMDCGDANHILVSAAVADVLRQVSNWEPALHDLGEVEVKHGARVHVFNLYTGEAGNPEPPSRVPQRAPESSAPRSGHAVATRMPRPPLRPLLYVGVGLVAVGLAGVAVWRATTQAAPPSPASSVAAKPAGGEEAGKTPPSEQPSESRPAPPPASVGASQPAAAPKRAPRSAATPSSGITGRYSGSLHVSVPASDVPATALFHEQSGVIRGCLRLSPPLRGSGPFQGVAKGSQLLATVFFSGGRTELQGRVVGEELQGSFLIADGGSLREGTFVLRRQSAPGQLATFDATSCPAD